MILISDVLKYNKEEYEKFCNSYTNILDAKTDDDGIHLVPGGYGFVNPRLRDERFAKFSASVFGVYPKTGEDGEDQYLVRVNLNENLHFMCICNHEDLINLGPVDNM